MATPHNQMRRLMAEDFALHLGTAAGNGGADFDEAARADTPADDCCEPPVYADLQFANLGMLPQLGQGSQVGGANHDNRLYSALASAVGGLLPSERIIEEWFSLARIVRTSLPLVSS